MEISVSMPLVGALVSPLLLYAGGAAVASPIIIHLLARRRFKRIRWAAIDFLLEAERRNRRRVRMEQLILLLLRCLIVLAIGALLARPFFQPSGLSALIGSPHRTERFILIDDSFSTAHRVDNETVFDRAVDATTRLVKWLATHASNDTVTLAPASSPDQPAINGAYIDDKLIADLEATLAAMSATQYGGRFPQAMSAIGEHLRQDTGALSAVVYVISDFQRRDWSSDASGSGGIAAPLTAWAGRDRTLKFVLVDVGRDRPDNTAVTGIRPDSNQFVAGIPGRVVASVTNYSDAAVERIEVRPYLGEAGLPTQTIDRIDAGETVDVPLEVTFPQDGGEALRVEIAPDALGMDDHRSLAVRVLRAIHVLLVDGEPAVDPYDDEVNLLKTALRPAGDVYSGNEVRVIEDAELEGLDLGPYHLIVLANVYRLSRPAIESLTRFVDAGGGLVVFAGDQVDTQLYNDDFFGGGSGLLPVELGEVQLAAGNSPGWQFVNSAPNHPLMRVFGGANNPFLNQVRCAKFIKLALPKQPALDESTPPEPAAGDAQAPAGARVLASFDDPDQSPAIVERTYGRGKVLVFATTCDQEWNNWARNPSYVITMLTLAQYAAGGEPAVPEALVGSPIQLPVDTQRFSLSALVRTPQYPTVPETPIEAVADAGGKALYFRWPQTQHSGEYRFSLTGRDGLEHVEMAAVNVDARESDLRRANEAELRRALGEVPVEYVRGFQDAPGGDDDSQRELWPVILPAALALLLVEQSLAWYFGRKH